MPNSLQPIYDVVEKTAALVLDGEVVLFEGPFRSLTEASWAVERYLAKRSAPQERALPEIYS